MTNELYEDSQANKYLVFLLENDHYGIDIQYVTEIIGIQRITQVPEMPDYIRGIMNLRGKIIPVMDVRIRFKKPFQEYNDRTCVVVIDAADVSVGLIVDSVSEVLTIEEEQIVPPPNLHHHTNKYVMGIGKVGDEVKLLLDCNKLLHDDTEQLLTLN